tara:strand:+ start:8469 stop:9092 length:624 start_codon:yes stop_codon:yes gene_type:complete
MTQKLRILPLSIVLLSMVFGIKIVDFSFGIEQALASQEAENKSEEGQETSEEAAAEDAPVTAPTPLNTIPTRKEIEYLQKLGQRRQELDRRADALDDRERLLEAVEKRIVERTESLKSIEATIRDLLKKHDAMEKAQLDRLVKMYSAMKAKDAAKIFNSLEQDVLISIVENMKEKDMGKILAAMDLNKAQKLTTKLATRKKLPEIEG